MVQVYRGERYFWPSHKSGIKFWKERDWRQIESYKILEFQYNILLEYIFSALN